MFRDYYSILEIDILASQDDIKIAFRKSAIKWHPDKNKGIDTTEKMQLINEAYLILKDKEAREKYDVEYKKYTAFKEDLFASKKDAVVEDEYIVEDETLNNWMNNARKQAVDLAKQTIKDFKDITLAGAKGVVEKAGDMFIGYIILAIIIGIISAIVGTCN